VPEEKDMREGRKVSRNHAICMQIPRSLNLRIDEEVLRRRMTTGKRISRRSVLIDILERNLPDLSESTGSCTE